MTLVKSTEEQQAIDNLGEQIAELSAHIEAAHYRLLCMIHEFDERDGWGRAGAASCAHWLSWRVGLGPVAAREKVRVARALATLPNISAALERGIISYSKARAITRVATPDNEDALLAYAEHGTAAQVEKVVRTYRRVTRTEQLEAENQRHDQRFLNTRIDDNGMLVIEGRLTPEVGALFLKALEQAESQVSEPTESDDSFAPLSRATASGRGFLPASQGDSAETSTRWRSLTQARSSHRGSAICQHPKDRR